MADNPSLPSYSIAIRTLGTSGEKFRKELESICAQTVQPERVMVYIADGHDRPEFTVGKEQYVWVKKGMVAQRALPYSEISSDCILLLDDDVVLAPDSAEHMLRAVVEHGADALGADVFKNHEMPFSTKVFAAISNLVFPHRSRMWAFKNHRNGSFSYNNHPSKPFYWSQNCGGPAMLWRKEALAKVHLEDERWLDDLGFAYLEDTLETYKLHLNGGKLGVLYDSGITHLDARSSSDTYKTRPDRLYIRTKASFMVWWRSCYRNGVDTPFSRFLAAVSFGFKSLWLIPVTCCAALLRWDKSYLSLYFKGLRDGFRDVRSEPFCSLPPFVSEK